MRFLRISRRAQLLGLASAVALVSGAGAIAVAAFTHAAVVARDRDVLTAQGRAVAGQAGAVKAYRQSVNDLARDVEARQDALDDLYSAHFGNDADAAAVTREESASTGKKISAAPEAAPLVRIQERQRRFTRMMTAAVERRAARAAAAIRSFGLNPDALARSSRSAQGGPFIPYTSKSADTSATDLKLLGIALTRLESLERSLVAIPSGKPTAAPMLSSSYGFRRDPFNGHAAFHAGLDFPGRYGQPILAAARGTVSYVGQRQGYGNVVEIDHGNGLMTRYAHLSGFAARAGQKVARGETVGKMGSTGRSTGTHLHFEVRYHDEPINPRRFLEARDDVLQIQQIAKNRFADLGNRG